MIAGRVFIVVFILFAKKIVAEGYHLRTLSHYCTTSLLNSFAIPWSYSFSSFRLLLDGALQYKFLVLGGMIFADQTVALPEHIVLTSLLEPCFGQLQIVRDS